jgi:hypothetical protein
LDLSIIDSHFLSRSATPYLTIRLFHRSTGGESPRTAVRLFCPRLLRRGDDGGVSESWERFAPASAAAPTLMHTLVALEAWRTLRGEWRSATQV